MSGLFISFEGGEGAGKTTQAELLEACLEAEGRRVVRVHEPGGTPLGEHIRIWVKAQNAPLTPEAELLLFAASRAELVLRGIRPALERGEIVIADRYADSTIVYQGDGRRLPAEHVEAANQIATGGLWPNLTLLLDMPVEESLPRGRVQSSFIETVDERGLLRFEMLSSGFHKRVRDGYLELAKGDRKRWKRIDASRSIEAVQGDVYERVRAALQPLATSPTGGKEPETALLRV